MGGGNEMIQCHSCSIVFDVTIEYVGGFICVNYCPICASEDIEDTENIKVRLEND